MRSSSAPGSLRSLTRDELQEIAEREGHARYRGMQIFEWLHSHNVQSLDEMSNVPTDLLQKIEKHGRIRSLHPIDQQISVDGTVKTLFELPSGRAVESVLIPEFENGDVKSFPKRCTICVSSQVGCSMGCTFCATGQMGFKQDLNAGEIVEQVLDMSDISESLYSRKATNIVFMGMGEPMLNYASVVRAIQLLTDQRGFGMSPRRITVSTVGLAKGIINLAKDLPKVRLAVSLHAPDDTKRSAIMPVNRTAKSDLVSLRQALIKYHQLTGNQVMYEYCMFRDFNDSPEDAAALAKICRWIPSKVNLIMFNPVPGVSFERTEDEALNAFLSILVKSGVTVTVRRSRGQDISAACGMLAVDNT